jgi:hypothetical protein
MPRSIAARLGVYLGSKAIPGRHRYGICPVQDTMQGTYKARVCDTSRNSQLNIREPSGQSHLYIRRSSEEQAEITAFESNGLVDDTRIGSTNGCIAPLFEKPWEGSSSRNHRLQPLFSDRNSEVTLGCSLRLPCHIYKARRLLKVGFELLTRFVPNQLHWLGLTWRGTLNSPQSGIKACALPRAGFPNPRMPSLNPGTHLRLDLYRHVSTSCKGTLRK